MKTIPVKKIPISDIIVDESNPNVMTDAELEALEKTIDDFGNASDIWVNKSGKKYHIIDGQHRLLIHQKKKLKTVSCRVFEIDDVDVKILRQVANKLRGTHDPAKDAEEFAIIANANKDELLSSLLGKPNDFIKDIVDTEVNMPENKEIPMPDDVQHACVVPGCNHGQD